MGLDSVVGPQPAPKGDGESVTDWLVRKLRTTWDSAVSDRVIEDLLERRKAGIAKYGCELKTNNGRNALIDAYQEALDLFLYISQYRMQNAERAPLAHVYYAVREVVNTLRCQLSWELDNDQ